MFKAYLSLLLLHWAHTSCMGESAFHLLCTEESMLNTEDKSTLSCANSYSNSCYWVKNMHSFLNSFMLYFHYVPYIVFRFLLWNTVAGAPPCALSNIRKTYRLSLWSLQVEIAPLCCSCTVSKSSRLEAYWKWFILRYSICQAPIECAAILTVTNKS